MTTETTRTPRTLDEVGRRFMAWANVDPKGPDFYAASKDLIFWACEQIRAASRASPEEGRAYANGYRDGVYDAAEIDAEPSVYVTDDAEKVERRRTVKRIKALADSTNPASRIHRPTRRKP